MTELSQAVMIQLGPFTQASGTVQLPGSKSISNRALLLAALASGETRLQNLLDADDAASLAHFGFAGNRSRL